MKYSPRGTSNVFVYVYTMQGGSRSLITHRHPRSKLRFWWLMLARVNLNALLVERPERVLEQTRRVILLFERNEALPILAERGSDACGRFAASEELYMIITISITILTPLAVTRKLTEGKEPPAATGLIVSRSHCEGRRKGREGGSAKEKKKAKEKLSRLRR
jgi:hypothetical protein